MHVQVWLDDQLYLVRRLDELCQPCFRFQSQSLFRMALRPVGLRRIEANKPVPVFTMVDCVTVNGNHLGCTQDLRSF